MQLRATIYYLQLVQKVNRVMHTHNPCQVQTHLWLEIMLGWAEKLGILEGIAR